MTAVINNPGFYVIPAIVGTGPKDVREPSGATIFLDIFNSITHLCLGVAACCDFAIAFMFYASVMRTHVFVHFWGKLN